MANESIAQVPDHILVTGSSGFIGSKVVETLLRYGYRNLRCFVRPSSNMAGVNKILSRFSGANVEVFEGNLLSRDDCEKAAAGISVIYHLAAGRGEKSYPDAYLNSVVTTRNLMEAVTRSKSLKRFTCVSSFTVYSTTKLARGALLDEKCDLEDQAHLRGEAYCYAKVEQEKILVNYGKKYSIPYVIVRPGVVYGPGNKGITGRVGIDTFGIFLHLGGSNRIPLSYVDNCADAIVLAGLRPGVDAEIFNIVDDDLPTSRQFLRMYKKNVRSFKSIYIPPTISYLLFYLWEKYSAWSEGQLPPVFNRKRWHADLQGNQYSNEKIKRMLGWRQTVSFDDACKQYFEYEKKG